MLELSATRAGVIGCFGEPAALDGLDGLHRIAPDEAMLVCAADDRRRATEDLATRLATSDRSSIVLDTTDGWAVLTLSGDEASGAFARLSSLELGEFVQGDVARLPARVLAKDERVHILVPAMFADYLKEEILALGATERDEPEEWSEP